MTRPTGRIVRGTAFGLLALFVAIQIIPDVAGHNPPVSLEVAWDSPETKSIARRACYDCHSNETVWPTYGRVAPFSWLIAKDVEEGREHLNFSAWEDPNEGLVEVVDMVESGEMPMRRYTLFHPEAALSQPEITTFIRGLRATFATDPPVDAAHADDEHTNDSHDS